MLNRIFGPSTNDYLVSRASVLLDANNPITIVIKPISGPQNYIKDIAIWKIDCLLH